MKVLVLSNGELKEKEINNTLEDLQKIVGGYIEIPFLSEVFLDNEIDIIINEEGKFIDGLVPEIAIVSRKHGSILDLVYGNCIFASHDNIGNTVSLNDKQINIIKKELKMEVMLHNKDEDKHFMTRALFIW